MGKIPQKEPWDKVSSVKNVELENFSPGNLMNVALFFLLAKTNKNMN